MLQKHEQIVAGAIIEYGGTVVKNIGDSVMAYFLDPAETVKAAVSIQQKFALYNREASPENQIHIRIGIHTGNAIVEDNDIFGDVVNVASKLTSLARGDLILVSEEVFNSVKDMEDISFNVIDLSDRSGIPKGLKAFEVRWIEGAVFKPMTAIALCIRPRWELGIPSLESLWTRLLDGDRTLWRGRSREERVLEDRSVILIAARPDYALEISRDLLIHIRDGLTDGEMTPQVVPVQVVIDAGPFLGTDTLDLESFGVNWEAATPGSILISHRAHSLMDKEGAPVPLKAPDNEKPFFEMRIDDLERGTSLLFLYQKAFLRGPHVPCFYCGSTVHEVSHCPSKHITVLAHDGIARAGYLSFPVLNSLFLSYVSKKGHEVDEALKRRDGMDNHAMIPHFAFYDVKKYFQLRFFRHIWDTKASEWSKIAADAAGGGGNGGLIWLAQDCIRVSNLTQAESLLHTCLEKNPHDYKVYCALGFLNLEKNKIMSAEYYFTKALHHAKVKTKKIYVLLLLCRLFSISGNSDKIYDTIREIKCVDPYCTEAAYQETLADFRQGRHAIAVERLVSLISENRDYFICALIDPDLAPFNTIIHPELGEQFRSIKAGALSSVQKAETEFETFKKLFGEGDEEVKKLVPLLADIQEAADTDSYFGYHDMIHQSHSITNVCVTAVRRREKEFVTKREAIESRLRQNLARVKRYRFKISAASARTLLSPVEEEVVTVRALSQSSRPDLFAEMVRRCDEILRDFDRIEGTLERLAFYETIGLFMVSFLRNTAVIMAVILFVALVVFPNLAYYCKVLLPDFILMKIDGVWVYQKQLIVFGVVGGLVISLCRSLRTIFKSSL
jgi:hypothetical protein